MAQLIAASTADQTSADVVVTTTQAVFSLFSTNGAMPMGMAQIQKKASNGQYVPIGTLTSSNPVQVLSAAGTYRVVKSLSTNATGVDQD